MSEKFTKRVMKWGLLQRVALPDKPWSFVNRGQHIFDDEIDAFRKASHYNTSDGKPAYLYKPISILLEVEIDKFITTKGEHDVKPIP